MKKILIILLLCLFTIPSSVLADGGIWRYQGDIWEPLTENEQRAAINYQDGLEKLIVTVNFDMQSNDSAVWIFPVPAKPQKVVIDVVTKFPQLYGSDPSQEAKSALGSVLILGTLTQIYPLFLIFPFYFIGFGSFAATASTTRSMEQGVTVYEHIEKEGITTEIVTAETGDALYNYLSDMGLNVQRNAISVFDSYIGEEYSFVVSWITPSTTQGSTGSQCVKTQVCCYSPKTGDYYWQDSCSILPYETYGYVSQVSTGICEGWTTCYQRCTYGSSSGSGLYYTCGFVKDNYCCCLNDATSCSSTPKETYPYYQPYQPKKQPGVFITFPTDKIYYPLLPTSIYGSTKIPITIYVMDYVQPKLYSGLSSYVKSEYYLSNYISTSDLESFYGNINTNKAKYTKIEILDAPSKYFTDDLWLNLGAPLNVGLATLIYDAIRWNPLISGIAIILIVSALAGAITGFVLFKEWKKYAVLGLTNIFTVIGLLIAVFVMKSDNKVDNKVKKDLESKGVMIIDKRKYAFVPLFSIVYLVMSFVLYVFISQIL